jgi:hypothetical protein
MRRLALAYVLLVAVSILYGQKAETHSATSGILFADRYAHPTVREKVNAAVGDLGGRGTIVVPATLECDGTRWNLPPAAVTVVDLRGCSTQDNGIRLAVNASNVFSRFYITDNPNSAGLGPAKSSVAIYANQYVDIRNAFTGTHAAINGSVTTNSVTEDGRGAIVGIEGEVFVGGNAGRTLPDVRGGTFNTTITANSTTNVTNMASLYAQQPMRRGSGAVAHAFGVVAELPVVGTSDNAAVYVRNPNRVSNPTARVTGVEVEDIAFASANRAIWTHGQAVSQFDGGIRIGASGTRIVDSRQLIQSVHYCGRSAACSNDENQSMRMVVGSIALTAGSATVRELPPFSSTMSYVCTATNQSAPRPLQVANTSTNSITITGSGADLVSYMCIGN